MGGDTLLRTAGLGFACGVSIAGGDSWVGIQFWRAILEIDRQVSIAGGDSWVGIPTIPGMRRPIKSVSIAGGDSWVGILVTRG